MEKLKEILETISQALEFKLIELGGHSISIYNIVSLIVILIVVHLTIKALERLVSKRFANKNWISLGKQVALVQIGKYILYVIGFVLALESIGVNTTALLIGSSALFVGLGFGLQEAFRDFISGIILLFEGDVVIGDVIEFDDGTIAVVKQINLRTSKVRTRDGIVMIVPNSQLINDRVINWSNSNKLTRFHVGVGVAYGSDVEKVRDILIKCGNDHDSISSRVKPIVMFKEFDDSSLNFDLIFWSDEVWKIEVVKSDLRFAIDKAFRESEVTIPFPQRDLHFKNSLNTNS